METWDSERAERAVVSLARYRSAADVFGMLWRYGARDYRNIGPKAIFVANAADKRLAQSSTRVEKFGCHQDRC